jgi:hypothetical protein
VSIDFTQQIEGMFAKQGFQNIFKFIYKNMFNRTVEFTGRQESEKIKSLLSKTESSIKFDTFQHNNQTFIQEQTGSIDLALASNMFSVGIDVNRLNLMLMIGQPGSVSEYIQASSRVSRKDKGLVINLLNPMRARELSIFEDFYAFHASYYKNVEPLSITPFTEMALNKLLNAVLVAYVKHIHNLDGVNGFNNGMKDQLINKVIEASKLEKKSVLKTITFIEYAKKIVKKENAQLILDSFGYSSELTIMNTYDAIKIMNNLDPENNSFCKNTTRGRSLS